MFKKICLSVMCVIFAVQSVGNNGYASLSTSLNIPSSVSFQPLNVQGMILDPSDPLGFEFILNPGSRTNISDHEMQQVSMNLIKYFLTTITVPDHDMWVNLSPVEKDRIIADGLGQTLMGKIMLEQDYQLKKLTASVMSPEHKVGHRFWERIYEATGQTSNENIPSLLNKIWIIPESAKFHQNGNQVMIVENKLKVMTERDYLAKSKDLSFSRRRESTGRNDRYDQNIDPRLHGDDSNQQPVTGNELTNQIIGEIIIPAIEHEVNHGELFAPLRQVFNAMLLGTWYKRNLKQTLLAQAYMNQNVIEGVDIEQKAVAENVWNDYVQLFQDGVTDVIREEYDPQSQETVLRQYVTGGVGNYDRASLEQVTAKEAFVDSDLAELIRVKWTGDSGEDFSEADSAALEDDVQKFESETDRQRHLQKNMPKSRNWDDYRRFFKLTFGTDLNDEIKEAFKTDGFFVMADLGMGKGVGVYGAHLYLKEFISEELRFVVKNFNQPFVISGNALYQNIYLWLKTEGIQYSPQELFANTESEDYKKVVDILFQKYVTIYGIDAQDYSEEEQAFRDSLSEDGWEEDQIQEMLDREYMTFLKGDIQTVEFPKKLHIAVSAYVLQYPQDPVKVFANIYNQLRFQEVTTENMTNHLMIILSVFSPNPEQYFNFRKIDPTNSGYMRGEMYIQYAAPTHIDEGKSKKYDLPEKIASALQELEIEFYFHRRGLVRNAAPVNHLTFQIYRKNSRMIRPANLKGSKERRIYLGTDEKFFPYVIAEYDPKEPLLFWADEASLTTPTHGGIDLDPSQAKMDVEGDFAELSVPVLNQGWQRRIFKRLEPRILSIEPMSAGGSSGLLLR